ncbi:ABC-2 transporter permease [Calidifontibacillus oryziterrae]|uniref:ABC-2 transporter permease n=1 Tax=Calidifontibacillus oryziterrae TaxID=1191699 RepID=UPI0002E6A011|nr:ABC-2 transporter permease [Calidifontibacillus oryziterrae]
MLHLIKKDILIQKKNMLISLLLIAFFLVTLSNLGPAGLSISILAISYSLALGASMMDDKTNSDMMLVSLPIKKSTIVLSKYISVFVFALYATIVNFILYFVITLMQVPLKERWFTIDAIIGAIVSVTIFTALALPLIIKWGYTKAKLPNFIIFFTFVIGVTMIISNMDYYSTTAIMEFFSVRSTIEMLVLTLIPLILLIVISYLISLKFYSNREF